MASMAPFRWPETCHDLALATEVAQNMPEKTQEWKDVAKRLSIAFSTEMKEVELKGWTGRQAMEEYAKEVRSGGVNSAEINDAMRWGSMCEDHAVATYIHKMPCKMFKKTGL
ncbi:hypothetical protein OS493_019353 [Desmophyllum pertusum]|uniref:Uncharacterized protein n=1 Tax=Desmophyllum pertusum TaxID=174260 RepID=A0A9X0A0H8_9CNID|nr:hypothetical protein OS493_019353 [Desmophyllum pertusum]